MPGHCSVGLRRSLLQIGFNLEETRPFVECLRSGRNSGAECPASVEVLARKLADIDDTITKLLSVRELLRRELRDGPGCHGSGCGES